MKQQLLNILQKLIPALLWVRRYSSFAFFVFLILSCSFLVYQVSSYAGVEPTEDEVSEQLKTITRPHIDQNSITKIQQLRDQNVQVEGLFQGTRDNPFSE